MLIDHLVLAYEYMNIYFLGRSDNHSSFRMRYQAYLDGLQAYDPDFTATWVSGKKSMMAI